MGRLAVILGSNALGPGGEEIAAAAAEHGAAIVQRHGGADGAYALPHRIDHAANLRPLVEQGCDRVLGIGSVGSPSTANCRSAACSAPTTSSPSTWGFWSSTTPAPTPPPVSTSRWRAEVLQAWRAGGQTPLRRRLAAGDRPPLRDPGRDPPDRRRTPTWVGMTIASECVVAGELGLAYAALCVVDNLANGIGDGELNVAGLEDDRLANAARLRDGLAAVLPRLGAVGR